MRHVDLVANDWMAGKQSWLARVIAIDSGGVKVEAIDATWEQRLQQPISLPGGEVYTTEDSFAYLEALRRKYQGAYVEATVAHDENECAFHMTDRPMHLTQPRADLGHAILGLVTRVVPGRGRRKA